MAMTSLGNRTVENRFAANKTYSGSPQVLAPPPPPPSTFSILSEGWRDPGTHDRQLRTAWKSSSREPDAFWIVWAL